MPKFRKKGLKALSGILIASTMYLGIAQFKGYGSTGPRRSEADETELTQTQLPDPDTSLEPIILQHGQKAGLNLDIKSTTPYDIVLNAALDYAKNGDEASRQKAIEFFSKAIQMDQVLTLKRASTFDPEAKNLYLRAVFQNNLEKDKKENKSHLGTYLLMGGAVVATAAAAYLLLHKKKTSTPAQPTNVTISLDAYNSTKGFQKDLTAKTVQSGSSVTVNISDTGVSGVDSKYIAVYREDFKQKIAFGSAGSATFTAPQSNVKYHIILFNALGTNPLGQQVSYDWVQGASLLNSKRNHIVYRKDFDGQTGPEAVWGGEYIPEIKANGVFDQLNSALNVGYATWGHVDRQPTATSGDFSYGFGNSNGADGWHNGNWITVNPVTLTHDTPRMVSIGLAEGFENLLRIDNIGGYSSSITMQYHALLNQTGKDLLVFAYIKDDAIFTASSNAMAQVLNAAQAAGLNLRTHVGGVNVGLTGDSLSASYQGKQLGVATAARMIDGRFANSTSASIRAGYFDAGFSANLSPYEQAYSAGVTARLKQADIGVRGILDKKTGASSLGLSIGKTNDNVSWNVGYGRTAMQNNVSNTFTANSCLNLGGNLVSFTGGYADYQGIRTGHSINVVADAELGMILKGLGVTAGYSNLRQGPYCTEVKSLGLTQQIGPGVLSFGLMNTAGKTSYTWAFSVYREL